MEGMVYPTPGLMPRPRDCLLFIMSYVHERGVAPSYKEIAVGLRIKSKSNVRRLLDRIEDHGYIVVQPHKKRGIEVRGMVAAHHAVDLKQAAEEMLGELAALYANVAPEYAARANDKILRWRQAVQPQ